MTNFNDNLSIIKASIDEKAKIKLKIFDNYRIAKYHFDDFVKNGVYLKAIKYDMLLIYPCGIKTIFISKDDLYRVRGMRFYKIEIHNKFTNKYELSK